MSWDILRSIAGKLGGQRSTKDDNQKLKSKISAPVSFKVRLHIFVILDTSYTVLHHLSESILLNVGPEPLGR